MARLADIIDQRSNDICASWLDRARQFASAIGLSDDELLDTVPDYLKALAVHHRLGDPASARTLQELQVNHLGVRLRQGFLVDEAVTEYALIGRCVLQAWMEQERPPANELDWLFGLLERAQSEVRRRYTTHLLEDEQVEKRYLRLLNQLATDVLRPNAEGEASLSSRLNDFLRILSQGIGAHCAGMFLCDENGTVVHLAARQGPCLDMAIDERVALDEVPFLARLSHTDSVACVDDEGVPDAFAGRLDGPDSHVVMGRRLYSRDELLGLVYLGMHGDATVDPRARWRLEVLGRRLAMLLDNARLYEQLREHMLDLHREREIRERFVSVLAHDLRSPLAAAKANAQLLVLEPSPENQLRYANKVIRSINRTNRMIQDLLDANRIRAGEPLPLQLEETNLSPVLHEVLEEMNAVYGDRFALHVPPDMRGVWDGRELKRAIWNLGSNGVKYGTEGSTVTIRVDPEPGGVAISVHNVGTPLDAEQRRTIFEPFARGRHTARQPGWGLGLTLVKGAAEAHGGRVEVEPDNRGNTFRIHLPLDARPYQPAAGASVH